MHVPNSLAALFQGILSCKLDKFPQTYLGLPLSHEKLRLAAFSPLIARVDRQLSGWKASLLNATGRTVLVNNVVDSSFTYAMSVLLLPAGTIDALDSKRHRFLWSGKDKVSGAQCLVAWENACQSKEHGGLGLKDLASQNKSLLLKLLHRLHHPKGSSWARWARSMVNLCDLQGDIRGPHWKGMQELLPMYQALTCSAAKCRAPQ